MEALAGTFNAQNVSNTLWAYATMRQEPGKGVMRVLEGRAEALAGTFNAQGVVNTLWAGSRGGTGEGAGGAGGRSGGHVQDSGSGKHAVGVATMCPVTRHAVPGGGSPGRD